ncbi:MAG TPA: protease modulator HflC, partial [Reyranella sp.]|nr:protease modulator HflC [Reyranella sp.]
LKAQITMGEADGEATKIYADTFSKDKDFYAFWRRMEAYKQAFSQGGSMVLSPDSDFFRYFNDPSGVLKK